MNTVLVQKIFLSISNNQNKEKCTHKQVIAESNKVGPLI